MYTGYTHTRSSICKRSPTRKKEKKKKGKRKKNRDRTLVYVQRGEIPRPPSLFFRPRTTDIDKSREWPNRSAEWAYLRRFWSDIYQRLASSNLSTRTRRETLSSDRIKPGKISILASVLRFSNLWEGRGGGQSKRVARKRGRGGFVGWAKFCANEFRADLENFIREGGHYYIVSRLGFYCCMQKRDIIYYVSGY